MKLRFLLFAALMLVPSGANAKPVSFLEAALFFLTAIEPEPEEISANRIALRKYPVVAYLVNDNPCAVRLRTTIPSYTVWQMDFCKIVRYEMHAPNLAFIGKADAFCKGEIKTGNEDYQGDILEIAVPMYLDRPSGPCSLGGSIYNPETQRLDLYVAFLGSVDMSTYVKLDKVYGQRSQARLLESMRYIQTILTPPERRKPY